MTRDEAHALMESVRANQATLDACPLHEFSVDVDPSRRLGKRWRCKDCGGEVDTSAKHWYEAGLRHAGRSG